MLITEDSVYVAFVNSKLCYLVHIRALMTQCYVNIRLMHCIYELHILNVGVYSAKGGVNIYSASVGIYVK